MRRAWQALLLSLAVAVPVAAEEVRYIVVLMSPSAATPDVAALGGRVERRQDEVVIVTVPAEAVAKLKADPLVKYTERVGGDDANEPVLAGAPADPVPNGKGKRAAVRPLSITSWDSGTYGYDDAGNITSIGTNRYTYDGVQRLKTSKTSGTSETYTYDGFGNMTQRTSGGSTQSFTIGTSAAPGGFTAGPPTNRLTSDGTASAYAYDAAGNMTSGGFYTWTYDALGQAKSKQYSGQPAEYYIYTASDERIGVLRSNWWTWSVRDESGKVLRQYRSSNTDPMTPALWLEDYVWANGQLLGSNRPAALGGRRHFHLDHLGSPRLVTTDDGKALAQREYLPFGQENTPVNQEGPYAAGFDREEPLEFTGHERDFAAGQGNESGYAVDYMHARYYSPAFGRFLSLDPMSGAPQDPQTWNRYTYGQNNPLRYTDPDGRCSVDGEQHGTLWCIGHAMGLVQTVHEQAVVARTFFELTEVVVKGQRVDAPHLSDQQVVSLFTFVNRELRPQMTTPQSMAVGAAIAAKVSNTLAHIDAKGAAPPGYKGGGPWANDGRRGATLPKTDANGNPITYREWDVDPKVQGVPRSSERLVTGSDGSVWYTDNHYDTFTRIR